MLSKTKYASAVAHSSSRKQTKTEASKNSRKLHKAFDKAEKPQTLKLCRTLDKVVTL